MDPPTAIRTKKLVLTRMLTEDSAIFDPSYLVYRNYVVDPTIANYKYSFPLAAFKASTICPFTYV